MRQIKKHLYFFFIFSGFFINNVSANSAIFFHPDGLGVNSWQAFRYTQNSPSTQINWDRLKYMGVYVGSLSDSYVATSNGGATSHAYGIKAKKDSYGLIDGKNIISASNFNGSIIEEAISKNFKTALINSGSIIEPGTGVFVAKVEKRNEYDFIAKQIIESGVDIIMSGGERHLLPKGFQGYHGQGDRRDGLNLIEEAKKRGYVVVYTKDELEDVIKTKPKKLLGVFAHDHSFNAKAKKEPYYVENAPTVAQMVDCSIELLKNEKFLMIVEEEGTDNFSNAGNIKGLMESIKRADETIGVMIDAQKLIPNLMIITASDSDAGGIQLGYSKEKPYYKLLTIGRKDYAGGILARSNYPLPTLVDNTDIYKLIRAHLFDKLK